jgi:Rad3-related DNA helicase
MQFLGRVARTPTDTGSIIILDYNFLMKKLNIKKKIIEILNEYGIFDKKQEKKEEKSFENAMINLFLDTI